MNQTNFNKNRYSLCNFSQRKPMLYRKAIIGKFSLLKKVPLDFQLCYYLYITKRQLNNIVKNDNIIPSTKKKKRKHYPITKNTLLTVPTQRKKKQKKKYKN